MTKRLLIIALISTVMFAAPASADVENMNVYAQEKIDEQPIGITVNGSSLHITGAQGLTLEVVSLTGRKVATVKIESPAQRVELNIPKGCYILKIGTVVRKVSIR